MTLPAALQKQVEEGNRLIAELHGPAPDPTDKATIPAPAPTEAELAPEQPQPQPQPQPHETAPQPVATADDKSWEERYKALQGKYNKEVPRMAQDMRELREQLQLMTNQMRELTAAPKPYQLDPAQIAAEVEIRPEEVEEYGDELMDLMGRRALQAVLPEIRRIEMRIEEIARGLVGVSGDVQLNAHEKFLQRLDNEYKPWRKLNTDEGFLDWLEQLDPFSGVARKHLLEKAVEDRDADRALTFFRSYEGETGRPAAPQQAKKQQDTALQRMAAPGQGRAAPVTPAPQEPEIWTRTDIARFYADVRKGLFKGREAEKERIEASIVQAAAQNRVVQA